MTSPVRVTSAGVVCAVHERAAVGGFALDEAQRAALPVVAEFLTTSRRTRLSRAGVYLWGGVGRGKTWLVDSAVASLPPGAVLRVHLHELFRRLHLALGRHRGQPGAMAAAVGYVLAGRQVLVVDELHLHDVGNAMLFTPVLRELLRRRVVLLATSNYAPDQLLADPLHHHLFEPAIALLRENLHVLEVDGGCDHRQASGTSGPPAEGFAAGAWLDSDGSAQLATLGLEAPVGTGDTVSVGSRTVRARAIAGGTVWFEFGELCEVPVAAADYLHLAGGFTTWVLHDVPPLSQATEAGRARFVLLVDVLCDLDRRLVLVGAPGPAELFAGQAMPPDVARTKSRLGLLRRDGHGPCGAGEDIGVTGALRL